MADFLWLPICAVRAFDRDLVSHHSIDLRLHLASAEGRPLGDMVDRGHMGPSIASVPVVPKAALPPAPGKKEDEPKHADMPQEVAYLWSLNDQGRGRG
jgi:hypothetical protein